MPWRLVCLLGLALGAVAEDFEDQIEGPNVAVADCLAWGRGLSIAAVGRPALFTIQPLDKFGNNITTTGLGKLFVVVVEPPSVHGAVMENGDGSLLVNLVHEWHVNFSKVSVQLNKTHLAASPYDVELLPYYKVGVAPDAELLPLISDVAPPPALSTVKGAFCTIVVSDPFAMGALVLRHTLRKVNSVFPLVVLYTSNVSQTQVDAMHHFGIKLKKVERIGNPKGANLEEMAWDAVYTKLRAWELDEYDKVVFMDSDQIIQRNIDDLMLRPALSAVPDLAPPTVFNSGLMVLEPSLKTFADMMEHTKSMKSYDEGDQGFLNEYFWGRWHALPFTYNYLKSKTGNPDAYYWFLNLQRWAIKVIHIVGVKPWKCTPIRDCGTGFMERVVPELWQMWWDNFEEVCSTGPVLCEDPLPEDDAEDRARKFPF